jgi:hypothetical protein
MRVCQFRHDGKKISAADFTVRLAGKNCKSILQSEGKVSNRAYSSPLDRSQVSRSPTERLLPGWVSYPSSLAFMVILAFSTFETGHPVLALFAAFSKAAASAPGTRPTTSR